MPESSDRQGAVISYAFGSFELLIETGTLLRNGDRVRIEDLPLRMLLVLLERPHVLVTRDELRAKLWGEKTFGASDNSLNVAAGKLRDALYDPARDSPYVETIRGKGYQFVSSVMEVRRAVMEANESNFLRSTSEATFEEAPVPPPGLAVWALSRRWGVRAAAVMAVILSFFLLWRRWQTPNIARGKVVIGRFINSTGDDAFNGIMQPALRYKLEESPYLTFVSFRELSAQLKAPNAASVNEELRACTALGATVLVDGEIALENRGYELRVNARRCSDGKLFAVEKSQASSQGLTLPSLGTAIQHMRGRLGEPPNSLQRFNVPLAQATTGSLAALKAFSDGEQKRLQGQEAEAIPDYNLSVDLDPQFALAYARMGTIYANLEENLLSRQNYQKAFDLRERTTDRERLYIASHYYSSATGEIERAVQAQELWRAMYPRDIAPANNLAVEYLALGQVDKAIEMAKVAQGLDSSSDLAYATLATAYLHKGMYNSLAPFCSYTMAHDDSPPLHATCFLFAFTRGDQKAMEAELNWARSNSAGSELLEEAAWSEAYQGKMSHADALFSEARESALKNKLSEFAAEVDADHADLLADLGMPVQARKYALRALELAPDSLQVQAYSALAFARIGDIANAQLEAGKAAAQAPKDTILHSAQLAAVRAAIALDQHDPAGAVHELEASIPYDDYGAMSLAPAYYRGLAFLGAKQPTDAVREFQKVIDHRNLAPDSPYVPLSHLQLSRVLQGRGDSRGALEASNAVKTIWKDADPGFPPVH